MSNILLDRTRPLDEYPYELVRQRIEAIMQTLSSEKQQFEKVYIRKIAQYEKEINRKDELIKQLSEHLQNARSQCEKAVRESELYKSVIQDLKQEFHRMENTVEQVSPRKEQRQLKRARSDYISKKQKNSINVKCEQLKLQLSTVFSNKKVYNQASKFIPRMEQLKSKLSEQTTTSAIRTNKINYLPLNSIQKKEAQTFTKAMRKWVERNEYPSSPQRKEDYVIIREYKENIWQQTF